MSYTTLQVSTEGGARYITLNRPEVRNAMSVTMVHELMDALRDAETWADVRVVVLRGAGGQFCAGGDIADMAQARMKLASLDPQAADADPIAQLNAQFGRLCLAYARTRLPVITVLEGSVMGGGFGLACVSDVTLALSNVVFRLPETSLGIIPAQIAPFLVDRLGYAQAKRLSITGAKVRSQEALALGLVHHVLPDETALKDTLGSTMRDIVQCAPGAIGMTKLLMSRARREPAESLIEDAARLFSQAVLSEEGQEGTAAFMQKRPPQWVPKEA